MSAKEPLTKSKIHEVSGFYLGDLADKRDILSALNGFEKDICEVSRESSKWRDYVYTIPRDSVIAFLKKWFPVFEKEVGIFEK